jgi:hypothetical protein
MVISKAALFRGTGLMSKECVELDSVKLLWIWNVNREACRELSRCGLWCRLAQETGELNIDVEACRELSRCGLWRRLAAQETGEALAED